MMYSKKVGEIKNMYRDIKNINIFRDMSGTYRTTNTGLNMYTLKKQNRKQDICGTIDYGYELEYEDFEFDCYFNDEFESEEEIMDNTTVDDLDFELDIVKDCFNAITKYNRSCGYLFSLDQVKLLKEYAVKKKYNPDNFKYSTVDGVIYVSIN